MKAEPLEEIDDAAAARYFRMLCNIMATQEGSITFAKHPRKRGITLMIETKRWNLGYLASYDPAEMPNAVSAMLADFDRTTGS